MSAPADDRRRERVLAAYDVLGRPPRRELDALAALAAQVAGVPYAAVNLFSRDVQHQVATSGFEGESTPKDDAMCRLVVESGEPIMVEDADDSQRVDAIFRRMTTRSPTAEEAAQVLELLREQRDYYGQHPSLRDQLLASSRPEAGESQVSDAARGDMELDPQSRAAWSVVANVLLNRDEFVTNE